MYLSQKRITIVSKTRNFIKNHELEANKNHSMYIIIALPIFIFLFSFTIGKYSVSVKQLFYIFYAKALGLNQTWPQIVDIIIFNVRLPRIIMAMIVGASLSISGATFQGIFKNPMVSPDILGASSGAAFGASLSLLYGFSVLSVQLTSFSFGILAVLLTYTISKIIGKRNSSLFPLVLTGMVVSNLFSSFTSMVKYMADPDNKLPAITFWIMGGLTTTTSNDVLIALVPIIIGTIPILLLRWKLNVLSFNEEEATALGMNVKAIRLIFICCATLITTTSVSFGGVIGWVGLIIPHVARVLVGPNYKKLIPASILLGSSYLLLIDDISRTLLITEIPLGILTALVGAPFFIFILIKIKKSWI